MRDLHRLLLVLVTSVFMVVPGISAADDTTSPGTPDTVTLLETVVVTAPAESEVMFSQPQPTPKSSVTKEGIDLLGGPGQTSIYAPLQLMPSVVVESPDPYGLNPIGSINIRGKSSFHLAKTVEDLPLTGVVGGDYLFDLENIERVDLYRGGLPANLGLGLSNASGAVNQQLRGPQDTFSVLGTQSFGSFNFRRTFARVDTGVLPGSETTFFLSGSTTAADKWTGAGDESRNNAMLGVSRQFGDRLKVNFYAVYDDFEGDSYRSLTYAQTQAISENFKYDYNKSLTGDAATDVNYYKFNRLQCENYAVLTTFDFKLEEGHHIILKPYYSNNVGGKYFAYGSNVLIWNQDNHNAGGVLEYKGHYGIGLEVVSGYWLQLMAPPPPPTDWKLYTVGADGSLQFARWATLAKIDDFLVNSPYIQVTETIGKTILSGGVRYMNLGAPKMQYYKTAGLPNVSYDQVWDYNPTPDVNATVAAKHYGEFLLNVGIRQNLSSEWSVSTSYDRKFGRPDWGPQASNYIKNEAAFIAMGITLEDLVDRVKPELSDQVDVSVSYMTRALSAVMTVFGAKNRNRQVRVVDPAFGGLSYYQGTAETTQYGLELEAEYDINNSWSIFGSWMLDSETYDNDTPTLKGGAEFATKGKQLPNTPNTMLKFGLRYGWRDLTISPIVRYIGKRYGDSVQSQPVDDYAIFDLNVGYKFGQHTFLKLSILNLFDRRYVSKIRPNDTNLSGRTAYYAGAPLTVAGSVSVEF